MFDEKSFSFEKTTIGKGLERLLPNLTPDRQNIAFGILGYTLINQDVNNTKINVVRMYTALENNFNTLSKNEISSNPMFTEIGKEAYENLQGLVKTYELGVAPDKRKVSKFRNKEIEILSRMNFE